MHPNELLKRFATGEQEFTGLKMPKANLAGADLIGIILNESDLHDSSLVFAYLNRASLIQVNLA